MVAKYDALSALEALPGGSAQDRALRSAAHRWPGCLRESQLAGPVICQKRRTWAWRGSTEKHEARAVWRERGSAAIPLWVDLHQLFLDQLHWRKQFLGLRKLKLSPSETIETFFHFTRQSSEAFSRWPVDFAQFVQIGGNKVCPWQAYRVLAYKAGITLSELAQVLFNRQESIRLRSF